ncbi:MAG: hypothetical protein WEB93_06285 [Sphingomonadales bacterium]
MKRQDMETRIRRLEAGLDHFDGIEWIIRVGDIARLKAVILNLNGSGTEHTRLDQLGADPDAVVRIDALIEKASVSDAAPTSARAAFMDACRILGLLLDVRMTVQHANGLELTGAQAQRSEEPHS